VSCTTKRRAIPTPSLQEAMCRLDVLDLVTAGQFAWFQAPNRCLFALCPFLLSFTLSLLFSFFLSFFLSPPSLSFQSESTHLNCIVVTLTRPHCTTLFFSFTPSLSRIRIHSLFFFPRDISILHTSTAHSTFHILHLTPIPHNSHPSTSHLKLHSHLTPFPSIPLS
jgi:hypothetical protein